MSEDGNWYDGLTEGDGALKEEQIETLKGFETQTDFANNYFELTAKDWREDFAGEDDKFKSQLDRYATPADFGQSWREQRATISDGKYSKPPGEGSTDDDIKAYREANGIPLESVGYMDNLPEGMVVGDDDKEIMADFMGALHSVNADPAIAHKAIEWYNKFAEEQQDVIAETDAGHHQETEDKLRQEWGSDYRANINLVGALLESSFGAEAKEQLLNGRFQDGRGFMNDPGVLAGFADISRKLNPLTQMTPPGGDAQKTLNDEIAELEKYMKDKRTEYFKDQPAQDRLQQLYDIRLQHEAKTKVA